jgi:hypothetical protein
MSKGKCLTILNQVLFLVLSLLILDNLLRGQRQAPAPTPQDVFPQEAQQNILPNTYDQPMTPKPTIGKLLMQWGPFNPMYERALATHLPHNAQHNYAMSILRRTTVKPLWSKPAFMLEQLLSELSKPADTRLHWLWWFDSDIVLLNPHIPLSAFHPPSSSKQWSHIFALVCQDQHGLNTGVFALKVDRRAAMLMAATLSTQHTHPHVPLKYNDQSAMEYWLQSDLFRNGTMHVPQRWFNAYEGSRGAAQRDGAVFSDPYSPQTRFRANAVQEGDLAVHFAGDKKKDREVRMIPWLDVAEKRLERWEVPWNESHNLQAEIRRFWKKDALREWDRVEEFRRKSAYVYES